MSLALCQVDYEVARESAASNNIIHLEPIDNLNSVGCWDCGFEIHFDAAGQLTWTGAKVVCYPISRLSWIITRGDAPPLIQANCLVLDARHGKPWFSI